VACLQSVPSAWTGVSSEKLTSEQVAVVLFEEVLPGRPVAMTALQVVSPLVEHRFVEEPIAAAVQLLLVEAGLAVQEEEQGKEQEQLAATFAQSAA
jgi:hypothetical protein